MNDFLFHCKNESCLYHCTVAVAVVAVAVVAVAVAVVVGGDEDVGNVGNVGNGDDVGGGYGNGY